MNELSQIIEDFIQYGIKAYKKQWRNTEDGRKLDRHQEVELPDDVKVSCWRELAVYQMAKYLQEENLADVEVTLDGNDSTLDVTLKDEIEYIECMNKIKEFFAENNLE